MAGPENRNPNSRLRMTPVDVRAASEGRGTGPEIVVSLATGANMAKFARAVGGEITGWGVELRDSRGFGSGSFGWHQTYKEPLPNPTFSEHIGTKTVRKRNLRFEYHSWDGMPDSDSHNLILDHSKLESRGLVLVLGNPDESFAAFVNPANIVGPSLSGFIVDRRGVRYFEGPKQMFSHEFIEASQAHLKPQG